MPAQRRWGGASVLAVNFSDSMLRKRMQDLSPSFLRIGGSAQDFVVYDVGSPPDCGDLCLSMDQWQAMHDAVNETGNGLVFGLSDLYGIVRHEHKTDWNSSNARALLKETKRRGLQIDTVALGNEPTSCFSYTTSKDLIARLGQLRTVVDDVWSDVPRSARPMITAPDIAPAYGDFLSDILAGSAGQLDACSFHYYDNGNVPGSLIDPERLDRPVAPVLQLIRNVTSLAPSALRGGVWADETGPAGNAYLPGRSLGYAYAPWFVDQLGLFATLGVRRMMRQTLAGGYYALVDWNSTLWEPRPDYYAAVLHKRLVGTGVLSAAARPQPGPVNGTLLRAYAQCAREDRQTGASGRGRVVWTVINLSEDAPWSVTVPGAAEAWVLRPTGGNITSMTAQLNGNTLLVNADGDLPPMEPVAVTSDRLALPPLGIAFVRTRDGTAAACQ